MLAKMSADRKVILVNWVWRSVLLSCRYVQQRLLLVVEWAKVSLSSHMVFPTSNKREIVFFPAQEVTVEWDRVSFLVPINLSFRHARFSLPVRGFCEVLHFWIYFISFFLLIFITHHTSFPSHHWASYPPSGKWLPQVSTCRKSTCDKIKSVIQNDISIKFWDFFRFVRFIR